MFAVTGPEESDLHGASSARFGGMPDPPDGPKFSSAADRLMDKKRVRFAAKHRELIEALTGAGHEPLVRVTWSTGEGGGPIVILDCRRCKARRRSWLPERWQRLSPNRPCGV